MNEWEQDVDMYTKQLQSFKAKLTELEKLRSELTTRVLEAQGVLKFLETKRPPPPPNPPKEPLTKYNM